MYRSKSKGNLEIPANAASYRSYTLLKAAEKANGQPTPTNVPHGLSEEDEAKSFLLNDSVLLSPGKDFLSRETDMEVMATPRKTRECPTAVMEAMKSHYIIAMKDLRKGFPAVCELVSCALGVMLKTTERDVRRSLYEGVRGFLTLQRFLVSCADMRSRYGAVEGAPTVEDAEDTEDAEGVEGAGGVGGAGGVEGAGSAEGVGGAGGAEGVEGAGGAEGVGGTEGVVGAKGPEGPEGEQDPEGVKMTASTKEKEKNKLNAKRYRRFHFQILIRIAMYKILYNREDTKNKLSQNEILNHLTKEIADLMTVRQRYDTWRFMESDLQYRCGSDPAVRELISEVCGELLLPLPEYSPEIRKTKKPTVFRSASRIESSEPPTGPKGKPRPFPNRQSSSGTLLTGGATTNTTGGATNGATLVRAGGATNGATFVRHRFARQRSCLDYNSAVLQSSASSTQLPKVAKLPKLPELRKSNSLDARGSRVSSGEGCFQPFRPTPYPPSMEVDNVFKMGTPFGCRTPSRQPEGVPHPLSPRGTPYRERKAALANILAPDSPSVSASAFLTGWSPFKRVAAEASSASREAAVPPDVTKPRRQLMF